MPWLSETTGFYMHAQCGGNETGDGLADVLFGDVGGRAGCSRFCQWSDCGVKQIAIRTAKTSALDVVVNYEKLAAEFNFPFRSRFELHELQDERISMLR